MFLRMIMTDIFTLKSLSPKKKKKEETKKKEKKDAIR